MEKKDVKDFLDFIFSKKDTERKGNLVFLRYPYKGAEEIFFMERNLSFRNVWKESMIYKKGKTILLLKRDLLEDEIMRYRDSFDIKRISDIQNEFFSAMKEVYKKERTVIKKESEISNDLLLYFYRKTYRYEKDFVDREMLLSFLKKRVFEALLFELQNMLYEKKEPFFLDDLLEERKKMVEEIDSRDFDRLSSAEVEEFFFYDAEEKKSFLQSCLQENFSKERILLIEAFRFLEKDFLEKVKKGEILFGKNILHLLEKEMEIKEITKDANSVSITYLDEYGEEHRIKSYDTKVSLIELGSCNWGNIVQVAYRNKKVSIDPKVAYEN